MNNFKEILVDESATIDEALLTINSNDLQAAIVISNDKKIIGTITDGDIRRSLIKKIQLSENVTKVMNRDFLYLDLDHNIEDVQSFLDKNDIKFVPVLKNKEIVEIIFKEDERNYQIKESPVFIMAGGFGKRLRPLTDNLPKPMLEIGKSPLLEIIINNFKRFGFRNFYISTHYLPHVIKDYFGNGDKFDINIDYVNEEKPLGTAGALGLLPKDIADQPIIIINGDILTNTNFDRMLDFHIKKSSDITIGARNYQYQIPYGVIETNGLDVIKISEKPIYDFGINSGIYIINSEIIKNQKINLKKDMPELIEKEIMLNRKVLIYRIYDYWRDIGKITDLEMAYKEINHINF